MKERVRRAYSPENPDPEIQRAVEALPKRHRDVIQARLASGTDWNRMEEIYYYSERRMRDIMNEGLDELERRLNSTEK